MPDGIAISAWQYRPALDPNVEELGYSAGSFDGRFLLSAFYTAVWGKNSETNFGLIYQRYRPFRYSYCYNGDANGDGRTANDLIYIPNTFDEIKNNLLAGSFGTVEEAWEAMDAFIEQDGYLRKHRGKYAERNGAIVPFANQLDFSMYHDIKIFQNNGRYHTLRFSMDIANFLNLLNKDWGVSRSTVMGSSGSPQYQFLEVVRGHNPSEANNYTVKYTMRKDLSETFRDNFGSYWQMQFGIKYIF